MSASQEKKLRQQLREEGKDKRELARIKEEKEAKRSRIRWTAVGLLLALSIVVLIVFQSNLLYRNFKAVQIGDTSYTAAEYNFFYHFGYNQFVRESGNYLSMMGLDPNKSLSSQEAFDGQTWAEYFKSSALETMKEITALVDEAEREGFTLNEEQQEALASEIKSFESSYALAGYPNVSSFVAANYGRGTNLKVVSKLIEKLMLADAYAQHKNKSFTYSADELNKVYQDDKDNFDSYRYISGFISSSAGEDGDEAAAKAEAKKTADAIVAKAEDEASFLEAVKDATERDVSAQTQQGNVLSESYADWLKSASRTAGDMTVVETDTGCYALYFIAHDDNSYKTVNVRHILVRPEADADGNYSAQSKTEAKKLAEDLLKEWKSGAATEDSFASLATEKTQDPGSQATGGLYEGVQKGVMVAEFNDWCFDESRKPGDTGLVYSENTGYHVMYFSGWGETYRNMLVENKLRSEAFTAWKTELLETYEAATGFTAGLVR